MKIALAVVIIFTLVCLLITGLQAVNLSTANPGPATQIAPVVKDSEIQINAKISLSNGTLWAIVDRTDLMNTVYGFGDQYQTENYGMGLLNGPEKVTVTVAYDRLDAQYPVPLNATNIHLTLNSTEIEWAFTKRTFHLFDTYLPELRYKILPVPQSFLINAHYEHPVLTTDTTYAYLGEYAFLIPLGQRYGLQEVVSYAYSEYPWFTTSSIAKISIEVDSDFTNMHVYSIDGFGNLTSLNYTDALQGLTRTVNFTVSGQTPASYETTVPYGIVVVFNKNTKDPAYTATPLTSPSISPAYSSTQQPTLSPSPTTTISLADLDGWYIQTQREKEFILTMIGVITAIVAIIIGLLIYFKKIKK